MKQAKTILFSALLTLLVFGAITYTSCTKDSTCSGVSCQNGGTCSGGKCLCPTGYSGTDCGTPVSSSITYTNDTYTPVMITANGKSATIPVNGSITYTGYYGNPLNAVAATWGMGTTTPDTVGLILYWNLSKIFPFSGNATYGIDVDPRYFFLKVQNDNTSYSALGIYVNYAFPIQTFDSVEVPNNGQTYGIGYYLDSSKTEIYVNQETPGISFWSVIPFTTTTFTKNLSYTFNLN